MQKNKSNKRDDNMTTITLNDDQFLLLMDVISRTKGDFDAHLYGESDIEGYAAVAMLQTHSKLENLERLLKDAHPKTVEFCVVTQSLQFATS